MLGSSSRVEAGALHSHPRHATTRPGADAHVMAPQTIIQLEAATAAASTTTKAEPNVGRGDGGRPARIQASSEAGSGTAATSGGHLGIQVSAEAEVQAQKVEAAVAVGCCGGRQAEAALCARQRGQVQGGLGAAGTGARQLIGHQVQEGDQLVCGRLIDPPGVLHLGDLPPQLVQLLLQGTVPDSPLLGALQLIR